MMKATQFLFLLIISFGTSAQTKISGKVTDEKSNPIPGANIVVRGTYDGTSSDVSGNFEFETTEVGDQTIEISFVGFRKFSKLINLSGNDLTLSIVLKEEINELDAVVISAGSFTAGEEHRRTVLRETDIATTAGATADIAGALNTLPGTQKVGESGRLFVRGGDGNETRTFIDGMMVLNAYNPSAPNTPSRGRFMPFMFKGTSFSTGGYSAEYGQALSSALVLDSKDKADLNQTDIGLMSVGGDIAHTQVWEKSSLSAKVQYTNIRPYFNLISQRVDWNQPPVSLEGSSAFRTEVGKEGLFKFYGNANHSNYSMYQHDILNPSLKTPYDLTNNYYYGNASYRQPLGERWFVHGGISFTENTNEAAVGSGLLSEKETGIHAKSVFENSISDRIELKVGGEIISRDYTASRRADGAPGQSQSFQEPIGSLFAESELYVSKNLVTRTGLRSEYNDLNHSWYLDPRISVAYDPFGVGQFSVAYGRFHQSVADEYLRQKHTIGQELSEHYIINYQLISDRRTFRAEIYYKRYSGLLKFDDSIDPDFSNDGNGYARGFDLFWRDSRTFENVDYWLSYSYLDTQRDYLNFPTTSVPSFASAHNFSLVYKHFINDIKSQLGFTYSYSSGRPYDDPNESKFNSRRTKSYQDLSANVAYLAKPWLIVYVSATNLLGRENVFGYEYSSEPNANGVFESRAIGQAAKRFLFLGVFITISKNKSVNQLPNL